MPVELVTCGDQSLSELRKFGLCDRAFLPWIKAGNPAELRDGAGSASVHQCCSADCPIIKQSHDGRRSIERCQPIALRVDRSSPSSSLGIIEILLFDDEARLTEWLTIQH